MFFTSNVFYKIFRIFLWHLRDKISLVWT